MIGEVLGSYRVLKKLGEGGMGEVYLAEHITLGNRAAVKLLRPEMSAIPDIVQRFFNEARATSLIGHPGIVQVFDFGRHEASRSAWFIMELLAGESLGRRLAREPRLPSKLVIDLALLAADALGAAHDAGIVHRDLKPDNIFLVPDRASSCGLRIKLLDFGIAKLANEATGVTTSANALMGTPAYMSPEQCRGAGGVDHRSDIYSLGCILYEMSTGQRPFANAVSTGDLVVAHMHHQPPAPRSIEPSIPEGLEQVILCTLAKAPSDRYQDITALSEDLERVSRGEAPLASARPTSRDPSLPPRLAPGGTLPTIGRDAVTPASAGPTTLGSAASQSIARSRPSRSRVLWFVAALVAGAIATVAVVRLTRSPGRTRPEQPSAPTAAVIQPPAAAAAAIDPPPTTPRPDAGPPTTPSPTPTTAPTTTPPPPHHRPHREPSPPTVAPPSDTPNHDDDRIKLPR